MGRRQTRDVLEEGDLLVFEDGDEIVADAALVQASRNARSRQHSANRGREGEVVAAGVIVEGPDAQMIASAEEAAPAPVVHGEGEVSEQPRGAVRPPTLPGRQDDRGIRGHATGLGFQTEHRAEVASVVEPRIGRQDGGAVGTDDRLRLLLGLGGGDQQAMAKRHALLAPRAGAVRAVRGQSFKRRTKVSRAVLPARWGLEAGDSAHDAPPRARVSGVYAAGPSPPTTQRPAESSTHVCAMKWPSAPRRTPSTMRDAKPRRCRSVRAASALMRQLRAGGIRRSTAPSAHRSFVAVAGGNAASSVANAPVRTAASARSRRSRSEIHAVRRATHVSTRRRRSAESSRRKLLRAPVIHLDEIGRGQCREEFCEIPLALELSDFVLSEDRGGQLANAASLLQQCPDPRAHAVEPIVEPGTKVQNGALGAKVTPDVALDGADDRARGDLQAVGASGFIAHQARTVEVTVPADRFTRGRESRHYTLPKVEIARGVRRPRAQRNERVSSGRIR